MIEIWGGIDAFKDLRRAPQREADRNKLLHGPKLDGDDGHASQDDVDAMFATAG